MPRPVVRDSIEKCQQSHDVFAMIRNPSAKISAPPKQEDTIKSLRGQMEREAVAQLGKAMQNFIFVARAGKIVFLAIAMPPYILLYGLPKWIMAEALPKLFFSFSNPFKLANEKIKNQFHEGVLGSLKNALAALSTKAAEYIKWIERASETLFVHLKHEVMSLGYRLLQPYMPIFQKGFEAAETVTIRFLHQTLAKGDQHFALAKQFASFAWKVAKQELTEQFRPFAELVKTQLNDMRKKLQNLIAKPRIEIQKLKTAIARRLKRTEEILHTTGLKIAKEAVALATAVAMPVINWALPKIQWSNAALQSGREKMIRNIEKMYAFVQNVAAQVLDAARLSRQTVVQIVKTTFEMIIPAFVKHFFNPEGGFKNQSQQMFQKFSQKLKKLNLAASQYVVDSLQAAKKKLFIFLEKIREFFIFLGKQIQQLPRRLFRFSIKCYHLSIYSSIQIGRFFQWMGIWSRVLGRLAWQELREKTSLLIHSPEND
jgi:hypothetical protein